MIKKIKKDYLLCYSVLFCTLPQSLSLSELLLVPNFYSRINYNCTSRIAIILFFNSVYNHNKLLQSLSNMPSIILRWSYVLLGLVSLSNRFEGSYMFFIFKFLLL